MIKRVSVIVLVTLILVTGIIIGGVGVNGVVDVLAQGGIVSDVSMLPAGAPYQLNANELNTASVYQRVIPSVVDISVVIRNGSGSGTGFVIDTEGHIVTNAHVVDGASYIQVTFANGTTTEAKLIGSASDSDLAVVRVDPQGLTLQPVTFADSDLVVIGQETLAIGNPFGQDFTLTTGIVSALDRSLRNEDSFSLPELIQTDAAINPGNSGGPLLDLAGNVIGVNTAIVSETRSASGIGFAIPSNTVRRVVPYLIQYGKFENSWLGIAGYTLSTAQIQAMNLPSDLQGVMISGVQQGSPAGQAGLRGTNQAISTPFGREPVGGDIITAINGEPMQSINDLIAYLSNNTLPGEQITLTVWRSNAPVDITVTLQARP